VENNNNIVEQIAGAGGPRKGRVHRVLAHSYTVYFILFLIGVFLDFFFPIKIFTNSFAVLAGVVLLIFASLLIFWAQKAGRDLKKVENVETKHFFRGPYCYTRHPTHWGLFFLMLGFGIIANTLFVILSTIISLISSKAFFLRRQERILTQKYGDVYTEYKKQVWL